MSTAETEVPMAEQPPAVAEETKPEDQPVKEKKQKASREKKPKQPKTASHPPYFQMIKEALVALNEKSGSSPYAIAKYMEEKHKTELPANFRKILALQLKNSVAKGKLIKIKASYKLSEEGKEKNPTNAPRTRAATKAKAGKKAATEKKTKKAPTAKKEAKKKPAAKKVGPKRTRKSTPAKPKQPKSIKSPAAKRVRKTAA